MPRKKKRKPSLKDKKRLVAEQQSTNQTVSSPSYLSTGRRARDIDVRISHRIIHLFSEGLYSSPNKALEELISNSFDAGAQNVHLLLAPDVKSPSATIVVIDDGEGMDVEGLAQHWIIGRSTRRKTPPRGRNPIGKFGIGKLSTYVLANQLTHITKSGGKYYAATMDYTWLGPRKEVATSSEVGVFNDETISIPVRELTELEASAILAPWISGEKAGYKALNLFGKGSAVTWTVAILSALTEMGQKIQRGRLRWILRTAMPLRDDFRLFFDGDAIEPSKTDYPVIQRWVIGKEIGADDLRSPAPDGLESTVDQNVPEDSIHRYGLSHEDLGRITGYVELYVDDIVGKSDEIERSNGFFVYVRGRMINTEDPGFGIERNVLRHGTFSKFRMVVHIDSLDEELRSSRESLKQGALCQQASNFMHSVFNLARNRLVQHEKSQTSAAILSRRVISAPGSLTRMPLVVLAEQLVEGRVSPVYTRLSRGIAETSKQEFLDDIKAKIESEEGMFTATVPVVLDARDGIVVFDINSRELQINTSHPFVASFHDLFLRPKTSLPLEMFAMTEVLIEAHLYQMKLDERYIRDILSLRDELLRQFVRSSARRTAGMISLALSDAKNDDKRLEEEMRAAFECIGFDDVIRIGGSGKPDGTAEAHLAATEPGVSQRYKVGLEAKSGSVVSAHRLDVAAIARHMKDYNCDHHVVIGNGFATSGGDNAATVQSINDHFGHTGKTITLMHIDDLARLVRIVPIKSIGLSKLRGLFKECITPEETKEWIDRMEAQKQEHGPFMAILETIWDRANRRHDMPIEYSAVVTALEYRDPPIMMSKQELIDHCKAMQVMARGVVFARENTVEIEKRPDLVIENIREALGEDFDI